MKRNTTAIMKPAQALSFKIFGEPASKANSRRIVRYGGMSRMIKSAKALGYVDVFKRQVDSSSGEPLEGDVSVTMTIWYASRRPDLDESLILDLLQGHAYLNDRQVKEKHIFWGGVDKENPRTEILVEHRAVARQDGARQHSKG